jgi:hypothetical protein
LVNKLSNLPKQPDFPEEAGGAVDPRIFGSDSILKKPLTEDPPVLEDRGLYGRRAYDNRFPKR